MGRRFLAELAIVAACCGIAIVLVSARSARANACPNAAFRTGPSAPLPDCRAYELVTPSYKNGSGVAPYWIARSGEAMIAFSFAGFAGTPGDEGIPGGWYRLARGSAGWTTTPMALPSSRYTVIEGVSTEASPKLTDIEATSFVEVAHAVEGPAGSLDLAIKHADGSLADMGPALPPAAPGSPEEQRTPEEAAEQSGLRLAGLSADGEQAFFSLRSDFWPGDATVPPKAGDAYSSLYEYAGTCGTAVECAAAKREPLLVGVDSQGRQISRCGTALGGSRDGTMDVAHNAVSRDGLTVFFTALAPSNVCAGAGPPVTEIFARIDGGLPGARTVAISEPSVEDCSGCNTTSGLAGAHFEGASAEGSKVFFSTAQPLLGGDTSTNLYEYDFAAPAGERVVRVSAPEARISSPGPAEMVGNVVQISEDGSRVYFVAHGRLTTGPNAQGQRARAGADNLYVSNTETRESAFVADLCSGPERSGSVSDSRCPLGLSESQLAAESHGGNDLSLWGGAGGFNQGGSDVTPDGRFLVFESYGDLTPDDTSTASQIFEYDAQTGLLVRVSIGQGGYNHDGNTDVEDVHAGIVVPTYSTRTTYNVRFEPSMYWGHLAVSADGSKVFFQSADALTPQAVDYHVIFKGLIEVVYAENVYEYSSLGGNIEDGAVRLISDGLDQIDAGGSAVTLYGTDASGQDVFFTTADKLVGQDSDEIPDVYDARVGGGFPPPSAPPSCSEEACQGALSVAPTLLSPGSQFQAGGNPPPAASKPAAKPKRKSLTQAQQLARALRACRDRPKSGRRACEAKARRRYGKKAVKRSARKATAARLGGRR